MNDDEELKGLCRVAMAIVGMIQLLIAAAEVAEFWKRREEDII